MKDWVQTSVPSHLSTLRSQTFVSAFSIFEGFLRHLVETYLVQFPQLLMRDDVTLKYHTIVDHATDIVYLITRELERFDRKDWRHKKKYLVGQLKLNEQGIWGSDKDNLWEQIETTRHRIIHSDQPTDVTNDFLTRCLEYLEGTMFALAAYSQAEHGIPFRFFAESTDMIARKDPPTL
ncbi:MAG: hypothetical protein KAU31_07990 [Spirochaetaceae bacterium]|nr:hypothetical protein [Spirochaetaceae bacterium]